MKTRGLVLLSLLLAISQPASAGYGGGNPRLERLYGMFLAPCCWRESLNVHNSPMAGEVRDRIEVMIQGGRSDDEIKSILVETYSQRILTLPEGRPRLWLFWTPVFAAAAGLTVVSLFLKRSKPRDGGQRLAVLAPAKLDDNWDAD